MDRKGTIVVKNCISVAAVLSVALVSGCTNLYKFGNANLRAVGAQALVIPPTPRATVETVPAIAPDTTLNNLALAVRDAVNGSADFQAAGISAAVSANAPAAVTLTYPAAFNLLWSGTATTVAGKGAETFQFTSSKSGSTTLTLGGTIVKNDKISVTASTNLRDSIAAVVNQSQQSCANFLGGLVLAETASNTSFDILSTITSALATVFSPLSTVHSLTAGTTILTGSKTAVDADIYAKASVANFATAIQSTYYADMSKYVAGLSTADATTLDWQIEMYKISVIHDECALAPAEASISATLQPSQTTTAQPSALSVSVTATDATLMPLAQGFATQINGSQAFKQAGVSAGPATQAGNDVTLALTYSSGGSIAWSASTKPVGASAGEKVNFATTTTGTTINFSGTVEKGDTVTILGNSSQNGGSTTAPPATTPPAVTPGHKVNNEPPKS